MKIIDMAICLIISIVILSITTMKNIVKKTMAMACFCSLWIFLTSANLANPDTGLQDMTTREKTVLDQGERKPFGEDNAPAGSPLRAAPGGGGGTGQKQEVPVGNGLWVLMGLALVYGIADKKFRKDK